jgi:hypothetical protein
MPSRAQRRAKEALSPDPAPTINARSPVAIASSLIRRMRPSSSKFIAQAAVPGQH